MTYRRAAGLGAVTGAGFAAGVAAVVAFRTVYTITRGHRWYQLKQL